MNFRSSCLTSLLSLIELKTRSVSIIDHFLSSICMVMLLYSSWGTEEKAICLRHASLGKQRKHAFNIFT